MVGRKGKGNVTDNEQSPPLTHILTYSVTLSLFALDKQTGLSLH